MPISFSPLVLQYCTCLSVSDVFSRISVRGPFQALRANKKKKPAHQSAEDRRRLSPPCAGVEQLAAAAQLLCSVVAVAFPFLVLFSTTCSLSPSGCAFGLTFSFFFPFFFLVRQASPSLRFLAETRNCWGLTRTLDGPFSTVSKLMFETKY